MNFVSNKLIFPKYIFVLKRFFSKFNDISDKKSRRCKPKDKYLRMLVPFMPITKIKGMKKVRYGQGSLKPKYFHREKPFNKKIKGVSHSFIVF